MAPRRDKLMKILVVAPNLPWVFVPLPYGPTIEQGFQLARGLQSLGHQIFWMAFEYRKLADPLHNASFFAFAAGQPLPPVTHAAAFNFSYVGTSFVDEGGRWSREPKLSNLDNRRGSSIITSATINRAVRLYSLDCVVLNAHLDYVQLNEAFAVRSVVWYAPYLERADRSVVLHNQNETYRARAVPPEHWRTLQHVSHVLAPSDRSRVALRLALGENVSVLNMPAPSTIWNRPDPPGATVRADVGADGSAAAARGAGPSREYLRTLFGVPEGAGPVVVVLAKNWLLDSSREGIDLAVLAFKRYRETHAPDAFLYLKALSGTEVLSRGDPRKRAPASTSWSRGVDVEALCEAAELPAGSYAIEEGLLSDGAMRALLLLADVLLRPVRAAGFGLSVLEAQALGTPVVTTRVGPHADFVGYGVVVNATEYHWLGRGFGGAPSIGSVSDALHKVMTTARTAPGLQIRARAMEWARNATKVVHVALRVEAVLSAECCAEPDVPPNCSVYACPRALPADPAAWAWRHLTLTRTVQGAAPHWGVVERRLKRADTPAWTLVMPEHYNSTEYTVEVLLKTEAEGLTELKSLVITPMLRCRPGQPPIVVPQQADLMKGRIDDELALVVRTAYLLEVLHEFKDDARDEAAGKRPTPKAVDDGGGAPTWFGRMVIQLLQRGAVRISKSLVLRDARCPPEEDVAVVDAGRRAQGGGGGGSWSVHNGQLVHSTHLEADSLLREGDRLPDG